MSILNENPSRWGPRQPTRWTLIGQLDDPKGPRREDAWTWLFETYQRPLETYARGVLARNLGKPCSPEDAAEAVQDFFAACVEKGSLAQAEKPKGRFRFFVRVLLERHCISLIRKRTAKRRSPPPGKHLLQIRDDDAIGEPLPEEGAEVDAFNASWARIAIKRALARLAAENAQFYLVAKNLLDTGGEGSPDLHERLGRSRGAIPPLKTRVRKRFNEAFEKELAETVDSEEDFRDEWRALRPYVERHSVEKREGKRRPKDSRDEEGTSSS